MSARSETNHSSYAAAPACEEDPLVLRHPGGLRGGHAGDDETGGEVDLEVGAQQLGVRRGDGAVGLVDGGQLLGGVRRGHPGVLVVRGHLGQPGPQLGDRAPVLLGGLALLAAQRRLHQRVHVDRDAQAGRGLRLVVGLPLGADDPVRADGGFLLRPVRLDPGLLRRGQGGTGLGAADQDDLGVPVDDRAAGLVDEHLTGVAAVAGGDDRAAGLDLQPTGHLGGQVAVGPRRGGHGEHRVDLREQCLARAAVLGGGAQCPGGQLGRVEHRGEVGGALHGLADPHDHRRAGVEHADRCAGAAPAAGRPAPPARRRRRAARRDGPPSRSAPPRRS